MICPYCDNEGGYFDNSNLNHKYRHSDCKKYFKLCPSCETFYVEKENVNEKVLEKKNLVLVDNIFDVDFCTVCNSAWLPDFPTSWVRSITNIAKVHELLHDLSTIADNAINTNNLFIIQRTRNGVIYNPLRAKSRGVENYIKGSGKRRMKEYLTFFRNAQILMYKYHDGEYINELTKFGQEFVSSKKSIEIIAYLICSFSNIKVNNGYLKPSKTSVYNRFTIRLMENILEIAQSNAKNNKSTSVFDFGLSILARNKEQLEKYSIYYSNAFQDKGLRRIFFSKGNRELNRGVKSPFINIFDTLGLISKNKDNEYCITGLGIDILNLLKRKPAIWYQDLENLTDNPNELAAKILIWRMVKHDLITELELIPDFKMLEKELSELLQLNLNNCDDLHFNLFYDEPLYNTKVNQTSNIVEEIYHFLDQKIIAKNDIIENCEALPVLWFTDILNIVINHEEPIRDKINSLDKDFKGAVQSGSKWHTKSRKLFEKMGLNCLDYKDQPVFNNIIIKGLNINLPGGTVHNPDFLILEDGYGPQDCILVDAKDENSINAEVHKMVGYNQYASDRRVDTFCIIALRGALPEVTLSRVNSNLDEFDNITIIEEKALEYLVKRQLPKQELLDLLAPNGKFNYLNHNKIAHKVTEKELQVAEEVGEYKLRSER